MTKFRSQGLHIVRIKYWNASGIGFPPSLNPTLWNIGICNTVYLLKVNQIFMTFIFLIWTPFFSLYLVRGQPNERFWDILHQNCIKRESYYLLMDYLKINSKMLCLKLYPCTLAMANFKFMPNLWVIFIYLFFFKKKTFYF